MDDPCSAPLPTSTEIVRRECFPRIPPEILLREHAARYHLMGLGLLSLLEALKPQLGQVFPSFGDCDGSAMRDVVGNRANGLLERKPPLPQTNIKLDKSPSNRLEEKGAGCRLAYGVHTVPSNDAYCSQVNRSGCVFSEVDSSRLTAVELVRRFVQKRTGKAGKGNPGPLPQRGDNEATQEDREALWGYSTGAVVHVTFYPFASHLRAMRQSAGESKRVRRRGNSASETASSNKGGDDDDDDDDGEQRPVEGSEHGSSDRGAEGDADEAELLCLYEQAPRGVSLLGYHGSCSVTSLVYHPINDLAVSGGVDGSLLVWDVHNRYRQVLRDKKNCDEDNRETRTLQHFTHHVQTRKLVQSIGHVHNGSVTSLEVYGDLLLSGGMDGTVRVWQNSEKTVFGSASGLPQYLGYQVFHCNGWVRHICYAGDRVSHGGDIMICSEDGVISYLKSGEVSPRGNVGLFQGSSRWGKPLLEALRNQRAVAARAEVRKAQRVQLVREGESCSTRQINSEFSSSLFSGNLAKEGGGKAPISVSHRGDSPSRLQLTRTMRTISEESRLARSIELSGVKGSESTNSITRMFPMHRHNILAVVGYSPSVRFLDISRLKLTSMVVHPSLTALSKVGPHASGLSTRDKKQHRPSSGGSTQLKSHKLISSASHAQVRGCGEALRFLDLLYINALDYMILLDNRNTVFVWDNTSNKMVASYKVPDVSDGGRNNVAFHLLPSGTRYYEGEHPTGENGGQGFSDASESPRSRSTSHYQAASVQRQRQQPGVTRIPFFVACTMGLELYDLVISVYAELEFKPHSDRVVGIFAVQQPSGTSSRYTLSPSPINTNGIFDDILKKPPSPSDHMELEESSISERLMRPHTAAPNCLGKFKFTCSSSDNEPAELFTEEELMCQVHEVDEHYQPRVLTCSGDGIIHVWGSYFHPICSYNNESLKKDFAELRVSVVNSAQGFEHTTPMVERMSVEPGKRTANSAEVEKLGRYYDTACFYYNLRWNTAVTGHDDGSIRYWHCGQQLPKCAWFKGLHQNTVSGVVGARISRWCVQQALSSQGMRDDDVARLGCIDVLATVSYDGHLKLWGGANEAKAVPYLSTKVSSNELLCVDFSEVGQYFVVGDTVGTISTWSAHKLEPRFSIPSEPPAPWVPRFAKLSEKTVRRFSARKVNREEPEPVIRVKGIYHTDGVTALLVDGNFVFSGGEDGRVFLWDLVNGILVREYYLNSVTERDVTRQTLLAGGVPSAARNNSGLFLSKEVNNSFGGTKRRNEKGYVVNISLLKERNGDLLISTSEGWIYHFRQSCSHPLQMYKHSFRIASVCVLFEGYEQKENSGFPNGRNSIGFDGSDGSVFELAVGADDGHLVVLHETKFSKLGYASD
ncbi:hypothetical protein, conserved [Trypanosoma brucei brucei TREU927]|uniref:Uncharacterized protein n=1 Tax=Trypanosoma brucei brucei (strain 927/4 GUTat10.1) TaxID=185431 RepID=Q388H9_TRYB2|nr:hypothetical protein, conserved [Trypanosoma brucei brucei TREU927]EAN78791.1 hypothetical protein, conserved [Trypanosoma brucei brucei TREU927]